MIVDDVVEPAVLTGFVREVPTPVNLMLSRFLPDRQIQDIEAAMDQVTRTNRAAKYRAWDSEAFVGQRDTFRRSKVKIPPLGVQRVIGEQERLMLERISTGGDNRFGYIEAIYADAEIGAREVMNRVEISRGDVLVDGKFTLTNEHGLTIEADFGLDPSHLVTASTVWSDNTNADILGDYKAWVDLYVDETGERPGITIASNTIVNNMLMSAQIRALFYRGQTLSGTPDLITQAQLNQVLTAYGYPPIFEYNTKIDIDGVATRVIPQDKLIFLPSDPSSLGWTAWGITAEALELAQGQNPSLSFQELPGLVGVVMKQGHPLRLWTYVGATAMPMLSDPRRLLVADVL